MAGDALQLHNGFSTQHYIHTPLYKHGI